jgi:Holliday junction resolvase RusA-like endonuclease
MDRRRRNIDNLSRVVLDLLIALQIVEDNSRVVSITIGTTTSPADASSSK